jgi:hypothetical protein
MSLKIIKNFIYSAFFVLFSCGGSSDDDSNQPIEDAAPPEFTISNIPQELEEETDIQIQITDESDVTTVILVNDVEVFTSQSKNFTYTLDPFNFTSGDKIFKVLATDSNGNEKTQQLTFNLKKLLFSYPNLGYLTDPLMNDVYIAINQIDGTLITFRKVEPFTPDKIYASDNFERQNMIVSCFTFSKQSFLNFNYIYTYADLEPGTKSLSFEEFSQIFNSNFLPNVNQNKSILIYAEGTPYLKGYNATIRKSRVGPEEQYDLRYANGTDINPLLYIKKRGDEPDKAYQYAFIDDFNKTEYQSGDLTLLQNERNLNIPTGSSYSLDVRAYPTEEDYEKNRYTEIYNTNSNNENNASSLKIPDFGDTFSIYQNSIRVQINENTTINISQTGSSDINLLDLNIVKNENTLNITGDFDYAYFDFFKSKQHQGQFKLIF